MQCIKCGKPVPEGELFCATCSLTPKEGKKTTLKKVVQTTLPSKSAPKSQGKSKRRKTLADSLDPPKPQPQRAYGAVEQKRSNFFPAFLIALLVAVAALSYIATTYQEWTALADINVEQAAQLHDSQTEIAILEGELATAQEELARVQGLLENAETTLETLQEQLGKREQDVNQTQYDMTTQQRELDEVVTENSQLTAQLATATAEREILTTQMETLVSTMDALMLDYVPMEEAYDFMNQYVVFVGDDGTQTYHRYGCDNLNTDSFWAYNRALAESNGNRPCPICFP